MSYIGVSQQCLLCLLIGVEQEASLSSKQAAAGDCLLYCRFLLGDKVTEADVRLFPTIFRFDHVYYVRFLLDRAMIVESYPSIQVQQMCAICTCL